MRPKFQSKQEVIINAPLEKVWEFNMDLSKIADYHPRVSKVDLISGKQFRETGVSYQCHLKDGKNTCIEKDIEIIPVELPRPRDRDSRDFLHLKKKIYQEITV